MTTLNQQAFDALDQAQVALKKGDKSSARYWARKAASLAPEREEPWLILAALGSPRASIGYLHRALELNPTSNRASRGMHWAVKRYRSALADQPFQRQIIPREIPPKVYTREKIAIVPWAFMISLIILGLMTAFHKPQITSLSISPVRSLSFNGVGIDKASPTPTQTLTATQSQTPTATSTPIPSLTPTSSETPYPTETPIPTQEEKTETGIFLPEGVVKGERWIDVDLTNQKIFAYQGKNLQNSFLVSTGTWQHPTVTGQYLIYVKYGYADMAGPGYYLPNVPYVMYFYKGYGIHGTYWHNNFGTPMSHGCINLKTEDAAWIFNWSSIGTMVNIHY